MGLLTLIKLLLHVHGAVVGVDIGHGTFKAALAQAGKSPFMLINPQSARTTPTAIMLKNPPRLVGSPAVAMGVKYPRELIKLAHGLVGIDCVSEPSVLWPREIHPFELKCDENERRWNVGVRDGNLKLWPEEIYAHLLDYINNLAVQQIRDQSSSVSIANAAIKKLEYKLTMPVNSTYRQYVAVRNAAKIANIKINNVIDSQLAAAAGFHSVDLNLEDGASETKLILDIGAMVTQGCLVRYEKPKPSGQVAQRRIRTIIEECHHVDGGAGGMKVDWVLSQHVMNIYETEHGRIKGQKRDKAYHRIMTEANKAKHVLSANKTAKLALENIDDGNSIDLVITRDLLEGLVIDSGIVADIISLLEKFNSDSQPLETRTSAIEWIGNGWRIPVIQEKLQERFPSLSFQTRINPDESPALGALYLGSNENKYKTPKVVVDDFANHSLIMDMKARLISEGKTAIDKIRREDKIRAQNELDRNEFESYLNKCRQLLTNNEKMETLINEEVAELAEKETQPDILSSIGNWFSGNKKAAEDEKSSDSTESPPTTPDTDLETSSTTTTTSSTTGFVPISERIPQALKLVEEANNWLGNNKEDTFDTLKGHDYEGKIKEIMNPMVERLTAKKKKEREARKAKAEEKKAQKRQDSGAAQRQTPESGPESNSETTTTQ